MRSVGAWLFQLWIRITGYPVYRFRANPKFKYEDRKIQGRIIKGKAVIVSNHTTVWDFGFWLYALPLRAHRCIMADVLMHKNFFLSLFLRMNQGIIVSRRAQDLGFIKKCEKILNRGGVVQVFPEARLAKEGEERPLPFTPSFVLMALETKAPIIPLYTSGNYFGKGRTKAAIGKPIYVSELYDETKSRKENLLEIAQAVRQKVIELGEYFGDGEKA